MATNICKTTVARNVRAIRQARKITQVKLAKAAGVAQSTISHMENPDRAKDYSPLLSHIESVASALRVPTWALLLDLEPDYICTLDLSRLIAAYTAASDEGRRSIDSVAAMASRLASTSDS